MNSMQHHLIPFTSSSHRVELFQQPEYRQSYSGSETDVSTSTSTENLSHEEKYVLRNSTRQEPQGEENLESNKSMDQSSCNTLIIHKNCISDEMYSRNNFTHGGSSLVNSNALHGSSNGQSSPCSISASPQLIQRRLNMQKCTHNLKGKHSQYHHEKFLKSLQIMNDTSVQEITDIPKDYLDQSEVLKHLAKEAGDHVPYNLNSLPPPPAYPKWKSPETVGHSILDKNIKFNVSRSQPDLTQEGLNQWEKNNEDKLNFLSHRPKTRGRATVMGDHEMMALRSAEMVELLSEENSALKAELEIYYCKVSKLQKLEMEIQKLNRSYEDLEKSSEKRERLSRAIRTRLEIEIKRLQDINKDLKAQLDLATSHLCKRQSNELDDSELRKELSKRDLLIAQLITQNKELVAAKERQEIELAAQRVTLQEQRTHIDILDSALNNAQANVVKLEEECRKKQVYVERVGQLQKALSSLQIASNKREQMEKKFRAQLEKEIQELQAQKDDYSSRKDQNKETVELKRFLREKEEKLMALQAEVSKWEQRYLEESAMRQIAIDAASMPKDAKIAALERTSQESERMIAQARTEKLKQMDEMHAINKRCADFESRIKDLESKLAEKEAMIKVLQKHSLEKDVAFQNAILRSPRHTPHSSLHEKNFLSSSATDSHEVAIATTVSSLVATSTTLSITNATASLTLTKSNELDSPTVEVDEQFKDLDSQMLSKDSIIQALRAEKEKYPNHFWRV